MILPAGRWAGTWLLDDHSMPLATAPTDRSLPGRSSPQGHAGPGSFAKPPLLQRGRLRGHNAGRGRRRPLLAVGGALVVLVCAGLGAMVANRAPRPVSFLAVARLVPGGTTVSASDLEAVSISAGSGIDAIPLRDAGQVIGHRVTEDLEPGSLLVPADLAPQKGLATGVALVGTSLAVNEMPTGLSAGQRVLVVLSGTSAASDSSPTGPASTGGPVSTGNAPTGAGTVPSPTGPPGSVLAKATVVSVATAGSSSGLAAGQATTLVATLEVPEAAAAAVTAASAVGSVSLAVIGEPDGTGAP